MADNNDSVYISKITFNDKQSLTVAKNDIVVFVGPNNAGKSQSLKDIYNLCDKKQGSIVVSDINIEKIDESQLEKLLNIISIKKDNYYSGYNFSLFKKHLSFLSSYNNLFYLSDLRNIFISYLDTASRLNIVNPPQIIDHNETKVHPIQLAAHDPNYRKWLSENFKKAFGENIVPNSQFGKTIPLCIGEPVKFEDSKNFNDEQERQEEYARILNTYKQVHDQGDGVKSFTGILLNLMISYHSTFIIDEPESFLHPPQAQIMGEIIAKTLSNSQQSFISTHSQEFIKGLISAAPKRVKIVRITRKDDVNSFAILNNDSIKNIWSDPLLKHSEIMKGLFYKTIVLCESDADCKMYSIIDSVLKETDGKFSDSLFVHCGGKQRIHKVVETLKLLNLDFRVIPDIDILNDISTIKKLVGSCGGDWSKIEKFYNQLNTSLTGGKAEVATAEIIEYLNKKTKLSKQDFNKFVDKFKPKSKWENLKTGGKASLPSGDGTNGYNEIEKFLKKLNIFIVPCGEIECFDKTVGNHGPSWVNGILEKYQDLSHENLNEIKEFVRSWNI